MLDEQSSVSEEMPAISLPGHTAAAINYEGPEFPVREVQPLHHSAVADRDSDELASRIKQTDVLQREVVDWLAVKCYAISFDRDVFCTVEIVFGLRCFRSLMLFVCCLAHTNMPFSSCLPSKWLHLTDHSGLLVMCLTAAYEVLTLNSHCRDFCVYHESHCNIPSDMRNTLSKMSFFVRPKSPISSKISSKFLIFIHS